MSMLECAVCIALDRSGDLVSRQRVEAETVLFGMAACYKHIDVVMVANGDYTKAWDLARQSEIKRRTVVAYPEGLGGTGLPYLEPNQRE
jgi:hypothetical protein